MASTSGQLTMARRPFLISFSWVSVLLMPCTKGECIAIVTVCTEGTHHQYQGTKFVHLGRSSPAVLLC